MAVRKKPKTREKKKNSKNEKLERYLNVNSIRALEGEGNERKFELSFASEDPYERWFGIEILELTENAVDLTRLNEIGVLLFNHNRDSVVGKIIKAWIDEKEHKGYAEVEFDDDEASDVIYEKVKSGTLKGVSIGYMVADFEEVKEGKSSSDGRFTGPCFITREWTPYEISIVSVPADATVGVDRAYNNEPETKEVNCLYFHRKQLQINKNKLYGGNKNESQGTN